MTNTSQVNNGQTTVTVNTNNLQSGKYKVRVNYPTNNFYNSSNAHSFLTLAELPYTVYSFNDNQFINLETGTSAPMINLGGRSVAQSYNIQVGPDFTFELGTDYDITFEIYPTVSNGYMIFGLRAFNPISNQGMYTNEGTNYSSDTMGFECEGMSRIVYSSYYKVKIGVWTPVTIKIRNNEVYYSFEGRATSLVDAYAGTMIKNSRLCVNTWRNNCGMSNVVIKKYK